MSIKAAQDAVRAFHEALSIPVGDESKPDLARGRVRLRVALINEEAKEFDDACYADDIVGAADALADIIYVALGAAVEFGLDLGPIFDEVHRSNMAKQGGPVRADGKALKPDGWAPPDIAACIRAQVEAKRTALTPPRDGGSDE